MMPASIAQASACSRFTIGRDAAGLWIVHDSQHLVGGIFVDRTSAMHFALAECDYNDNDVTTAPDGTVLSLDDVFEKAEPRESVAA